MSQRTFRFRLRSSHQAPDRSTSNLVIAFMQERIKLCPISRNLPEGVHKEIRLTALD